MQAVISDYNFRKLKIGKAGLRSLSLQQYGKNHKDVVKLTLHMLRASEDVAGKSWKVYLNKDKIILPSEQAS